MFVINCYREGKYFPLKPTHLHKLHTNTVDAHSHISAAFPPLAFRAKRLKGRTTVVNLLSPIWVSVSGFAQGLRWAQDTIGTAIKIQTTRVSHEIVMTAREIYTLLWAPFCLSAWNCREIQCVGYSKRSADDCVCIIIIWHCSIYFCKHICTSTQSCNRNFQTLTL